MDYADTLLGQLESVDVTVTGIGGDAYLRLYGESKDSLAVICEDLNMLAKNEKANIGIGIFPETICGSVEMTLRLTEMFSECAEIVAFYKTGYGRDGLEEAKDAIDRNLTFGMAIEYAEKVFVHERAGKGVKEKDRAELTWSEFLWNAKDYIIYQTNNNDEPQAASILILLGYQNRDTEIQNLKNTPVGCNRKSHKRRGKR